jgi:predicted TPR repeat methyltransferase
MNTDSRTNSQPVVSAIADCASPLAANIRSTDIIEKEFDAYAEQYESALNEGLSVSGERPEYFAQKRVEWVAKLLSQLGAGSIDSILDFGCGVGIATPLLKAGLGPNSLWGFDPSSAAIDRANKEFARNQHVSRL